MAWAICSLEAESELAAKILGHSGRYLQMQVAFLTSERRLAEFGKKSDKECWELTALNEDPRYELVDLDMLKAIRKRASAVAGVE